MDHTDNPTATLRAWSSAAGWRVDDLARALHVAVHLLDQRLGALEAPLPAQALQELQSQRLVVEVALEVEDVGLYQLSPAGLECGSHADADGRSATVGE